jgi:polar amino acid transport system ATP-binding protein
MTMLLVTHELPFAQEVSDWVVFIDRGHVVEEGPPAEVLEKPEVVNAYLGAGFAAVG